MKITGTYNQIEFDLENGNKVVAEGEILVDRTFVVFKHTMKFIDSSYQEKKLTPNQIEEIIREVQKSMNKDTVQLIFE